MADTRARKIRHVLCNCECRHAQTGFEALSELDTLLAMTETGCVGRDCTHPYRDEDCPDCGRVGIPSIDEVAGKRTERAEVERLRGQLAAARAVVRAFTAEAEDWNDGEYALWKKDDLIMALVRLRAAFGVEAS